MCPPHDLLPAASSILLPGGSRILEHNTESFNFLPEGTRELQNPWPRYEVPVNNHSRRRYSVYHASDRCYQGRVHSVPSW